MSDNFNGWAKWCLLTLQDKSFLDPNLFGNKIFWDQFLNRYKVFEDK